MIALSLLLLMLSPLSFAQTPTDTSDYVKAHSDRVEAKVNPIIKARYAELASTLPVKVKPIANGELFLSSGNLMWRDLEGKETVLVDGSKFEKNHSISGFEVSPDGKKVAYHTTYLGQDLKSWNAVTLDKKPKTLLEKPVENRMQGFSWNQTSDGFYYSYWNDEKEVEAGKKPIIESRFRDFNTQKDSLVFDHKLAENFTIADVDNGNTLLAYRTLLPNSGIKTTFSLYKGTKKADGTYQWESIYPRNKYVALYVGTHEGKAIILTSQAGNTYGISQVDIATKKVTNILPAKKGAVLHQAEMVGDTLILQYSSIPELHVTVETYDLRTKKRTSLPLKSIGLTPYGDLEKFEFAPGSKKAVAKFSDIYHGDHLVELDLEKNTLTPLKNTKNARIDTSQLISEHVQFKDSKGKTISGRLYYRRGEKPKYAAIRSYNWLSIINNPEVREVWMAIDTEGAYFTLDTHGDGSRGAKEFLQGIRNRKEMIRDISSASDYLQKRFQLKPKQIVAIGRSWGGLNSYNLAAGHGKNFGDIHSIVPVVDVEDMLKNGLFGRIAHSDLGPRTDKNGNYILDEKFWRYVRSMNPPLLVDKIPPDANVNLFTSGLDDRVDASNQSEVNLAKRTEARIGNNFHYHRSITGNHGARYYQVLMYSLTADRLKLEFKPLVGELNCESLFRSLK